MSSQRGELRPTSGWDLLASLGHLSTFQRVSRLGSVTSPHSSSGHQPNFAALNRGHHLYSTGRPSRWGLAHILVFTATCVADADIIFLSCLWSPYVIPQTIIFLLCGFHLSSLWSPYVIGQTITFLPGNFYLLSFFPRLISAVWDWMSTILPHNGVALVRI